MCSKPKDVNSRCTLISDSDNEALFRMLGHNCLTLSSGVVQLLLADPEANQWKKSLCGVACFVKDSNQRSYFIRIYDIKREQMIWQQELYTKFRYKAPRDFAHTFEADECQAALNFASEDEALAFKKIVDMKLVERHQRRMTVPLVPGRQAQAAALPGPPGPSTPNASPPARRLMDKLDPDMKKLFLSVGIKPDDKIDVETMELIFDFVDKNGGIDAFKKEMAVKTPTARAAPPLPARTAAQAPPPPPPARTSGAPPPPPVNRGPPPPPSRVPSRSQAPPPPPPKRHVQPPRAPVVSPPRPPSAAPMAAPPPPTPPLDGAPPPPPPPSGGPSPPPPPPPPPGGDGTDTPASAPPSQTPPMGGAPPPSPPPAGSAPPPPPPPPPSGGDGMDTGRGNLFVQIHQGMTPKKVEPGEYMSSGTDARGDLLKARRVGANLKKAEQSNTQASQQEDSAGLVIALARALASRSKDVAGITWTRDNQRDKKFIHILIPFEDDEDDDDDDYEDDEKDDDEWDN